MSHYTVPAAFADRIELVPIESIVPQREVPTRLRARKTYELIAKSLEKVGLVEPLVVFPRSDKSYLLVDGHVRLEILKKMGAAEVRVIFAAEDEAYTYNRHVSCITGVTQHFMILKAIANGVTEGRLAEALNVDVSEIRLRRRLLDGICPEAVELLRHHRVPTGTFLILKKMKPARQVEVTQHMCATATYSTSFAKALLEVTRPEFLLAPPSRQKITANSRAAQSMLELESESLVENLKALQGSYGTDILSLTVFCAYVRRLLTNVTVERYLLKHHSDVLSVLRSTLVDAGTRTESPAAGNTMASRGSLSRKKHFQKQTGANIRQ